MTGRAIETEGLTKIYPTPAGWFRRTAAAAPSVQNVHLQVEDGEIFGLLGPNGAGKTTLTKMLCTLISPTAGSARVAGFPLVEGRQIRAAVGLVVTDERSFYWRLSGERNLTFFAALHNLHGRAARRRIAELLEAVGLTTVAGERFSAYSSGMKQRLAIARSLLHRPRILFLDEPTRSLDPAATQNLHALIRLLNQEQEMTIFLITHDLNEAEKLCRQVGLMHQGALRTVGTPADLRRQVRQQIHYTIRVGSLPETAAADLRRTLPDLVIQHRPQDAALSFQAGEAEPALGRLLAIIHAHSLPLLAVENSPPSLEEVFNYYTQRHQAAG